MNTKLTIFGNITADDNDPYESTGSLTLRSPRNVPNFDESFTLTVPGEVKQICAGQSHFLALRTDGCLYSFGSNQFGQRGVQGSNLQLVMRNVSNIAVGLYHSVAITQNNEVYVWGRGSEGQLGLGDNENQEEPQLLSIQGQQVCCGSFHTIIRNGNIAYVMGENQNGQLGVKGQHNQPQKLSIPVDQMAAGLDHTIFLSNGNVYVTGNNLFGQCGVSEQIVYEPIKLQVQFQVKSIFSSMGTFSGAISTQGNVFIWGTGSWGYARKCTPIEELCKIEKESKIDQVLSGENFALLRIRNNWFVFGQNKMPETFATQTHRIQLQQVNLGESRFVQVGLNVVFVAQYIQEIQKIQPPLQNQKLCTQLKQDYQKYCLEKEQQQQQTSDKEFREGKPPLFTKFESKYESRLEQSFDNPNSSLSNSYLKQQQQLQQQQQQQQQQYQSQDIKQQQQKCYECLHLTNKQTHLNKNLKFQEEEISNLKKELDIIKNYLKQKDIYIGELETRILKYQDNQFKSYKPSGEVRLKSEERAPLKENQMVMSKVIENSPQVHRTLYDYSPQNRNINTSIIDKIQNYQLTAKSRQVPMNQMPRFSVHEVQNSSLITQNTYVLPQYFKGAR